MGSTLELQLAVNIELQNIKGLSKIFLYTHGKTSRYFKKCGIYSDKVRENKFMTSIVV